MMLSCKNGHKACAQLLLERGAAVNAAETDGWTSLMAACYNGHEACARLVLEQGTEALDSARDLIEILQEMGASEEAEALSATYSLEEEEQQQQPYYDKYHDAPSYGKGGRLGKGGYGK